MATSMENLILNALATKLAEITYLETIEFKRIRLSAADFYDNEMPGVQIFDNGQFNTHQRTQMDVSWNIIVELFQKANPDGSHDAELLYDRKYDIELKIGENPKLAIPASSTTGAMFHVKYNEASTNIFMVDGVSVAQLNFEVLFRKPFTGFC